MRGGTGTMLVYGVPFSRIWATLDAAREPAGRDALREAVTDRIRHWMGHGNTADAAIEDLIAALADPAPGGVHINDGSAQARAFAEEGVGAPCWFCGRHVGIDYLIAGYDTWDEQRLACLDCDRAIKALREKGLLAAPEDHAEGLDVERLKKRIEMLHTMTGPAAKGGADWTWVSRWAVLRLIDSEAALTSTEGEPE